MKRWQSLRPSPDNTHHLNEHGTPAYALRFDEVLKFHSPGLAPVRTAGEAWHIHADGAPAYSFRFRRTFGFYEGFAAVESPYGWLHIHPDGTPLYSPRYAWCGNFQGARCTVRTQDGDYFHLTTSGQPAYDARWHYAGDFRDGIAVVQANHGRSTHINSQGRTLHQNWYLDLDVFHKGYARARDEEGWMHVNTQGTPLYQRRFANVEPFYNGQSRVERFDGGLEVIDEKGNPLIEIRPAMRSEFAELSADMVGFWRTQTIAAAAELGLFDALPGTGSELAAHCGLNANRAERLLEALSELSLTKQQHGIWEATSRGAYLRTDHPLTLCDASQEYAGPFTQMWKALPESLRDNTNWITPDIFDVVSTDRRRTEKHHRMLQSYARHDYTDLPKHLPLQGDETVVDVGGGMGVLCNLLLEQYPQLSLILLDRPEVIRLAQNACSQHRSLTYKSGDIFQPWPVEADVILLARVLHDWDDDKAQQILRHARNALRKDGKLIIIEMLLSENNSHGHLCDLHLLMATGGRERTQKDYHHLLTQAGFELREYQPLPALPSLLIAAPR